MLIKDNFEKSSRERLLQDPLHSKFKALRLSFSRRVSGASQYVGHLLLLINSSLGELWLDGLNEVQDLGSCLESIKDRHLQVHENKSI